MKVAVVVSTYPPYQGGMGNVAAAHAEALKRAGHEITVFAPGKNLRSFFTIGNAASVPQLVWKLRGFDAVELHYPFFGGAEFVWLWKKLFGREARLAVLYHMDTVGKGVFGLIFRAYRVLFLKSIMRAADAIMVTSRDYFQSSQISFLKNDPRVREVPLGVDSGRFLPAAAPARNVALFVGGLDSAHYFKGLPQLIAAFARVAKHLPEAELRIVGGGNLRASYEALAKASGAGDRIRFLGRLDEKKLADAYQEASVHALPSIDRSEAFGLVTLAAGASGIPSIVSDLPGVRSLIVPGETGLIVKPGDIDGLAEALKALLSDPVRAAAMGRAARERVERLYASTVTDHAVVQAVCG